MVSLFAAVATISRPLDVNGSVAAQLTAAKAICQNEWPVWRRQHPKADLALSFADPRISSEYQNVIRRKMGLESKVPVLDSKVLTIVFDAITKEEPNRLEMDAYVFLGSFPKGYRAHYVIRTVGKVTKVVAKQILQSYDVQPPGQPSKSIT